jgi:hypothetical protein
MPDSRKTGVSAVWMTCAMVSSVDPLLSMPNINGLLDRSSCTGRRIVSSDRARRDFWFGVSLLTRWQLHCRRSCVDAARRNKMIAAIQSAFRFGTTRSVTAWARGTCFDPDTEHRRPMRYRGQIEQRRGVAADATAALTHGVGTHQGDRVRQQPAGVLCPAPSARMLRRLRAEVLRGADDTLPLVILFSLSGLDLSLWLLSKPWFSGIAEAVATAM